MLTLTEGSHWHNWQGCSLHQRGRAGKAAAGTIGRAGMGAAGTTGVVGTTGTAGTAGAAWTIGAAGTTGAAGEVHVRSQGERRGTGSDMVGPGAVVVA